MVTKVKGSNQLLNLEEYTSLKAGEVLYNFLNSIDTVGSNIGELSSPGKLSGGCRYIVSGLQLSKNEYPTDLLSDTKTRLEVGNKFKEFDGKSPLLLLREYMKTINGMDSTYKLSMENKLKLLNNNKLLILPFKLDDNCIVYIQDDNETHTVEKKIKYIMWNIFKGEDKLTGKVFIEVDRLGVLSGMYKFKFSEYGKSFRLEAIERDITGDVDRNIIAMSRFGYIHPIEVVGNSLTVAVDGAYLYVIIEDEILIGDALDNIINGNSQIAKILSKHKSFKYIQDNIKYIEKHRRFIAPYKLVDANVIKL